MKRPFKVKRLITFSDKAYIPEELGDVNSVRNQRNEYFNQKNYCKGFLDVDYIDEQEHLEDEKKRRIHQNLENNKMLLQTIKNKGGINTGLDLRNCVKNLNIPSRLNNGEEK